MCAIYDAMGVSLDPQKQQPMGVQRMFLGVLLNLTQALSASRIIVDVKPGLRELLHNDIARMIRTSTCSPGEAAKLRGRLTWAASAMFGKCARGGQGPIVARQYAQGVLDLDPELLSALQFVQSLVGVIPPRQVPLHCQEKQPILVYTDASWEPADMQAPGLGTVILVPGQEVRGFAASVPPVLLRSFVVRETQIAPLEALAVLQATLQCRKLLKGCEVVWFCDNQAVCATLVKGSSPAPDIALIASAVHLLWALIGARVWIEWVDSSSNISDGLSRDALKDVWTSQQGWSLQATPCVPWEQFSGESILDIPWLLMRWADEVALRF